MSVRGRQVKQPLLYKEVTLTSEQILASNTSPVELIPAPGAGKIINIVSCVMFLDYATAAYATNTSGVIKYSLSGGETINSVSIASISDLYTTFGVNDYDMFLNSSIVFETLTGNPTAGDSPITFYILYQIITL